jgi:hypothetical protein
MSSFLTSGYEILTFVVVGGPINLNLKVNLLWLSCLFTEVVTVNLTSPFGYFLYILGLVT